MLAANNVTSGSYDDDEISLRLDAVFGEFFGTESRVFAVSTGTAANALALAALVPPWGAVVCHEEAHIQVDEAGAPEFFTGGAKLILARAEGAILTPDSVAASVSAMRGDVHEVRPGALSITQASEYGRVYTPDQVAALAADARQRGWRVHMDGARLANALVHLGCQPADVTWRAGVDVLSFGCIKNGGMTAEALVFFDRELAETIPHRRKRAGQMPSKGRFAAAQLIAMIESGAWERNARAANKAAGTIAAAAADCLMHPVESNEIFLRIGADGAAKLRQQGFAFYDWGKAGSGEARIVASWDTDTADAEALAAALQAI